MRIRMFGRLTRITPAAAAAVLFVTAPAGAQDVNCLMCHENPAFFQSQENGERRDVHVELIRVR